MALGLLSLGGKPAEVLHGSALTDSHHPLNYSTTDGTTSNSTHSHVYVTKEANLPALHTDRGLDYVDKPFVYCTFVDTPRQNKAL